MLPDSYLYSETRDRDLKLKFELLEDNIYMKLSEKDAMCKDIYDIGLAELEEQDATVTKMLKELEEINKTLSKNLQIHYRLFQSISASVCAYINKLIN